MAPRHGAPASNKPHSAEKTTPVWLAIWRTWAGFANSQLRCAAFRCIYSYIYVPIPVSAALCRCSDIANLSAHLHRLPTPPPYLRQMRLSPGWGASIRWVIRLQLGRGTAAGWQMMLLAESGTLPHRPWTTMSSWRALKKGNVSQVIDNTIFGTT